MTVPLNLPAAQRAIKAWVDGQIGPAVVQVDDVTFAAHDDGTYAVELDGTPYAHASVGEDLTTLIDSLVALINAGANAGTASNVGGTILRLTADAAGMGFATSVASTLGASAMSIALTTANRALGALVAAHAVSPYTSIWGYQDAAKPPYPYVTISWARNFVGIGGKAARTRVPGASPNTYNARAEYDADAVLRVELLSRTPLNPSSGVDEVMPLISGLEAALYTTQQVEAFTAVGLVFVSSRSPVAIPNMIGFGHERRGTIDVVFRARVRVDVVDVPVLEMESIDDIQGTVDDEGVVIGIVGTAEE